MNPPVRLDVDGAIAIITLDSPSTHNALTPRMLCLLADAVMQFAADDALRVAIVTGAGDRAFCAGGDLSLTLPLMSGARPPQDEWDRRLLSDPQVLAASGLREFPLDKPVIAAINGICMAAGFELMLGTDIRIAAEHARFGLPEATRALIPFAGSIVRLPRQISWPLAMELMLTGDPLDASRAREMGLVNRVVPGPAVLPTARAMAERIAGNGPLALRAIKRTATRSIGRSPAEGFELENAAKSEIFASDDAREGPRAFMEKRLPVYRGR